MKQTHIAGGTKIIINSDYLKKVESLLKKIDNFNKDKLFHLRISYSNIPFMHIKLLNGGNLTSIEMIIMNKIYKKLTLQEIKNEI